MNSKTFDVRENKRKKERGIKERNIGLPDTTIKEVKEPLITSSRITSIESIISKPKVEEIKPATITNRIISIENIMESKPKIKEISEPHIITNRIKSTEKEERNIIQLEPKVKEIRSK